MEEIEIYHPEASDGADRRHIPELPFWLCTSKVHFPIMKPANLGNKLHETAELATTVSAGSRGPRNFNQEQSITKTENLMNQNGQTQHTGHSDINLCGQSTEDQPMDLSVQFGQEWRPLLNNDEPDLIIISDEEIPSFDQYTPSSTSHRQKRKGLTKKRGNKKAKSFPKNKQSLQSKYKINKHNSGLSTLKSPPMMVLPQNQLQQDALFNYNNVTGKGIDQRFNRMEIASTSQNLTTLPRYGLSRYFYEPSMPIALFPYVNYEQYFHNQEQYTQKIFRSHTYSQNDSMRGGHLRSNQKSTKQFFSLSENHLPFERNYIRCEMLEKPNIETVDAQNVETNMHNSLKSSPFPEIFELLLNRQNPPIYHNYNQDTASIERNLPFESISPSSIPECQVEIEKRTLFAPEISHQTHTNGQRRYSSPDIPYILERLKELNAKYEGSIDGQSWGANIQFAVPNLSFIPNHVPENLQNPPNPQNYKNQCTANKDSDLLLGSKSYSPYNDTQLKLNRLSGKNHEKHAAVASMNFAEQSAPPTHNFKAQTALCEIPGTDYRNYSADQMISEISKVSIDAVHIETVDGQNGEANTTFTPRNPPFIENQLGHFENMLNPQNWYNHERNFGSLTQNETEERGIHLVQAILDLYSNLRTYQQRDPRIQAILMRILAIYHKIASANKNNAMQRELTNEVPLFESLTSFSQ